MSLAVLALLAADTDGFSATKHKKEPKVSPESCLLKSKFGSMFVTVQTQGCFGNGDRVELHLDAAPDGGFLGSARVMSHQQDWFAPDQPVPRARVERWIKELEDDHWSDGDCISTSSEHTKVQLSCDGVESVARDFEDHSCDADKAQRVGGWAHTLDGGVRPQFKLH